MEIEQAIGLKETAEQEIADIIDKLQHQLNLEVKNVIFSKDDVDDFFVELIVQLD